ncbi:MAG: hypothetical protein K1X94_09155 [Sandaracinaceae bacterium]|nr:hypothetical protein [Sandaracinaceae bacterium]
MLGLRFIGCLLAVSLVLSGCPTPANPDAGTDAYAPPPDANFDGELPDAWVAPPERLVVGYGETMLDPIEDGETLLLARGCQGSQHVWISLRADAGFDPRGVTVQLDLFRERDDLRVSLEFLVRLSFTADASGTSSSLLGLTLQVPMPDIAIGEDLRLEATITDRGGMTAHVERHVQVAWGTEVCGSF